VTALDLKQKGEGRGWIGVDFDRTLAHYESWATNGLSLGAPIPSVVERVKRWVASGWEIRIFTARASRGSDVALIEAWCEKHIGCKLAVTDRKDFKCVALWDDIAVSVQANEGIAMIYAETDPLTVEEEVDIVFKHKWTRGDFDGVN
jgi:hypothetical protein